MFCHGCILVCSGWVEFWFCQWLRTGTRLFWLIEHPRDEEESLQVDEGSRTSSPSAPRETATRVPGCIGTPASVGCAIVTQHQNADSILWRGGLPGPLQGVHHAV